jgi:hypothetical protein
MFGWSDLMGHSSHYGCPELSIIVEVSYKCAAIIFICSSEQVAIIARSEDHNCQTVIENNSI